jgi:hypothetical protein
MLGEKLSNLAERDGGLGQAIVEQILRVHLAFVNLELARLHPGRAERAMHPHRVAQQQVACTGGQDGWRESVHIAVDRRYQRVLQVVAVSIHYLQWFPPGNADAIFGKEIEVGAAILGASEKISRQ